MDELSDEFEAWCGGEGLADYTCDAQELLMVANAGMMQLTAEQRAWLNNFIERWDRQQALVDRLANLIDRNLEFLEQVTT